ncbi:MAG: hypothetical protein B7Z81_01530 [Acidocella sp. 20-61-6]|nr:MAG: hypothetical protein B7Z81_01530 [Acidocella sp. 20-61-6]
MSELPRIGAEANFSGATGPIGGARDAANLRDRAQLLREINLSRQRQLESCQVFLVVINIADTKRYDDIIRVFGYKFADDLLNIRLLDLDFISARQPTYRVGFWSVGYIFNASDQQDYESSLNQLIEVLARPVICRGIPVFIQAGVGICDLALGLGAAEDLLQATFLAGQIGAQGSAGWSECNYDLADDHRRAFSLIAHAAHSLSTPYEFELNYQARVEQAHKVANRDKERDILADVRFVDHAAVREGPPTDRESFEALCTAILGMAGAPLSLNTLTRTIGERLQLRRRWDDRLDDDVSAGVIATIMTNPYDSRT